MIRKLEGQMCGRVGGRRVGGRRRGVFGNNAGDGLIADFRKNGKTSENRGSPAVWAEKVCVGRTRRRVGGRRRGVFGNADGLIADFRKNGKTSENRGSPAVWAKNLCRSDEGLGRKGVGRKFV